MNLSRLSLFSILGCLVGLVVLTAVTLVSATEISERQEVIGELLALRERINDFSVASDNLVMFGADEDLWRAYQQEAETILATLADFDASEATARRASSRVEEMVEFVGSAVDGLHSGPGGDAGDRQGAAAHMSPRARIIQQRVASQGISLDTVMNNLLRERQRTIAREATWVVVVLAAGMLLFGATCVVAFGLIHRRVARPARAIAATLHRVQSGDTDARADVRGNDELSRLAGSLNRALDERDRADAHLAERQDKLQEALTKLADTRDRLVRAQSVADIGSWDLDLASGTLEWSDQVYRIFGLKRRDFDNSVKAFFERVHEGDRHWLHERQTEWLERGGELDAVHRIVRPDGNVRWVRQLARTICGDGDRPESATGTIQDITEQYRMDERLRQFQQLIEGSEDLCGIIDDSYHYVWLNRAYLQSYDLDPEAIQELTLSDVLGEPYFQDVVRPCVERCLAGEPQRFETKRDLPGKPGRRLLARYYPIDMPGGSPRRVGAVITDVTDVRKAEAEIERRERLLNMAGRAARFGAWGVDLESDRAEWSDVVAEIHGMPHGYSPTVEEAIQFYAPEYRENISRAFSACVARGEPYDQELQIIDADGHRHWVRTVGEAVRNGDGAIIGVQGAFQDISGQKALELESRRLSDHLAGMLEAITDGFVAFDEQWHYTYVNARAAELLGKPVDELLGTNVWSQFPGLAGTQSERALLLTMEARVSSSAEEFFEPLEKWFDMRTYPWEGGVAAYFRDVTESHRMLEQLQAQEAALRASAEELNNVLETRQALINSLPAHIAMLDRAGFIVDVNEQWRHFGELNAYRGSDFGVGTNYLEVCEAAAGECSSDARSVAGGLRKVLDGRKDSFALEYPCHSPHEQRWFRAMFSRLSADEAMQSGAVAMHIDITERKRAEQQINRLAYEDPLTGVLSRHGFVKRLDERLERSGWPTNGVLAMIDVVNQHDINDAHGYEIGDILLTALSRRLRDLVGESGLAGRTGGDEFVVYFPTPDGNHPESFLERLRQAVDEPFFLNDGEIAIEIDLRIGYTDLGNHHRHTEKLIREAELALFEHRRSASAGKTQIAYTSDLKAQTRQRIQLTNELRHALDAEEFELHFQPKVNLADGSLISAEALIRWRHPERGLLSPGLFIPVAEQSQLIGPIGDWALRAACWQLSQWQAKDLDAVRVAVNVSQVQFMLGDFSAKVQAALEEFGVAPDHLSLEITESVFERHSDRLLSEIRELKKLGVRLSLDDFGTGYSSLLYLQRYPFDEIKIDRGFVDRILEDRFSRDIVLAVMNLARALDAEVVAEGIESRAIAAALLEMGCQYGQGFYYSMPLESEDFRWLLQQRSKLPLIASGGD